MKSKPTYKEIELNMKRFKRTYVVLIILLFSLLILFSYIGSKNKNLLEENKILEEKLSEFYRDYGGDWGLEYVCDSKKGYWEFNSYGDYRNAKHIFEDLNCEVIE